MMGRPYDFSNLMQINRLRVISPGLGRFVGRFTSWFGRYVRMLCLHVIWAGAVLIFAGDEESAWRGT